MQSLDTSVISQCTVQVPSTKTAQSPQLYYYVSSRLFVECVDSDRTIVLALNDLHNYNTLYMLLDADHDDRTKCI